MFVQEKLLTFLLVEKTAFAFILGLLGRFTCTLVLVISLPLLNSLFSVAKISFLDTFYLF